MIKISFFQPCGTRHEIQAAEGQSLMEVIIANNLPGIDADCGGQCACGTCHVSIKEPWFATFAPPAYDELEMLNFAAGANPFSRLACQVRLGPTHDGVVVVLPEGQH